MTCRKNEGTENVSRELMLRAHVEGSLNKPSEIDSATIALNNCKLGKIGTLKATIKIKAFLTIK